MMKNSLMDNLSADYVRTAIAKGLSFRQAVLRHAVRNSLIPIATSFGNNISVILTGSFLIERIYNIDGFGLLGWESVVDRDYPVVMGILVLSSLLFLVGNILSDICVAVVDPRVKFGQ
jgi:microcin C transport system permease protein